MTLWQVSGHLKDESHMLPHSNSRTLPRMGVAFGAALTLLAATGDPARAAGSTLVGEGLHIASGALVDPNGRTWVADHNGGFCRMTPAGDDGPGRIEHPQVPGGDGPRTCLGGLLPDAAPGPDAAGQPVFIDPSPLLGDEMALIPDGAAPSSEVVRAKWNRHTGLFEFYDTITMDADRGRPTSLAVGADDAVYVGFQREGTIQRITDAAADFPVVEVVGATSDGRGAQSIAAGRDAGGRPVVYVSETAGLAVLEPGTRTARTSPASVKPGVASRVCRSRPVLPSSSSGPAVTCAPGRPTWNRRPVPMGSAGSSRAGSSTTYRWPSGRCATPPTMEKPVAWSGTTRFVRASTSRRLSVPGPAAPAVPM